MGSWFGQPRRDIKPRRRRLYIGRDVSCSGVHLDSARRRNHTAGHSSSMSVIETWMSVKGEDKAVAGCSMKHAEHSGLQGKGINDE